MRRASIAVAVLAAALGWWLHARSEFRLPARMQIEHPIADLGASFDPGAVVEQVPTAPVHVALLEPSPDNQVNGGARRAVVAVPPSRIRFRTRIPPDAKLRLAMGVTRPDARPSGAMPILFTVSIDGTQRLAREVDPARKRDRGWLSDELDLAAYAGREVEIALATGTAGSGPAVGIPGWAGIRLVRAESRLRTAVRVETPNVLVLLVDTLRADRLGCYGATPSHSPNLDRLAATGRVFENAIAQSSWTVPSVASLFTGLHPRSHGVWGAPHDVPDAVDDRTYLPDVLPTLARTAQTAGITTFGVSANPLISRGTNFAQGFETFVEFGMERRFAAREHTKSWASAAVVDERFFTWLRTNRRYRFLAYLQYMEPHDPYTPPDPPPPPPGVRPAVARGDVFPIAQQLNWHGGPPLPQPELDYLRELYDREIEAWDAEFGALLAALDRLGMRDSTVIVVTADHGEEFQEHGALRHGVDLYEETLHVPLVIAGPGITPGRVATQVQGIDLFPTVAGLLGIAAPADAPGRDVLRSTEPPPAFSELGGGLVAVRADGWKLIAASGRDHQELYDLATDPGEHTNRYGAAPAGAVLAGLLAQWQHTAPAAPPAAGHDPQIIEKLRALGYVD